VKKCAEKSLKKRFLSFNFLGEHFATKANGDFWNQHKILDLFYSSYGLFQEKNVHLYEGPFLKFLEAKAKLRKKPLKI
jgi:hypothetical protein